MWRPEYDVATSKWGEGWRMPQPSEFDELIDKCEWKWMRKNRVWGMHITGPNGNSIFLPAADSRSRGRTSYPGEEGRYWSSSPGDLKPMTMRTALSFVRIIYVVCIGTVLATRDIRYVQYIIHPFDLFPSGFLNHRRQDRTNNKFGSASEIIKIKEQII